MHKLSGKPQIIKIITLDSTGDIPSYLSELHLESLINPLTQECHMPLSEHFTDDAFIYLVRPHYSHGNLLQAMKIMRVNLLAEKELKSGAKPVLSALNSIHEAGYLHGNVRPQSIFIHRSDCGEINIALGKYDFCCPID